MTSPPESKLSVVQARNGSRTATAGSIRIHSSVNPEHEAELFLNARMPLLEGSAAVILGSSLGYLTREIRRRFPAIRIITLDYTHEFSRFLVAAPDHEWHPHSGESVGAFLHRVLPEEELAGLAIIEWQPAARAFPARARQVAAEFTDALSELNANIATTGYFGRRWVRNAFANFLCLNEFQPLPPSRGVTVIAASGPSLERSAQSLVRHRDAIGIWALGSAVAPLLARGIVPDLVVLTDPGYYGIEHLHCLLGRSVPVMLPLTSARGVWRTKCPVVLIDQGSTVEDALLPRLGLRSIHATANGTVAGTALDVALKTTGGPIVFAGFDLAQQDLQSHASPHAFDRYIRYRQQRRTPETTMLFERNILDSAPISGTRYRSTRAHVTFRNWFASWEGTVTRSVYRLSASPVSLPMQPVDEEGFRLLIEATTRSGPPLHTDASPGSFSTDTSPLVRVAVLEEIVDRWQRELSEFARRIDSVSQPEDPRSAGQNSVPGILRLIDLPGLLRIRRLLSRSRSEAAHEAGQVVHSVTQFLASTLANATRSFNS